MAALMIRDERLIKFHFNFFGLSLSAPQRNALHSSLLVPVKQNKIHGLTLHNDGGQAGYKFHGANLFGLLGGAVDIFYVFDEEGTEDRHE